MPIFPSLKPYKQFFTLFIRQGRFDIQLNTFLAVKNHVKIIQINLDKLYFTDCRLQSTRKLTLNSLITSSKLKRNIVKLIIHMRLFFLNRQYRPRLLLISVIFYPTPRSIDMSSQYSIASPNILPQTCFYTKIMDVKFQDL